MVLLRSIYVVMALLGVCATAAPTGDVAALNKRCIPDDPTSCSPEDFKRAFPEKRCIPDDPSSCSPGDFGKRDVPVKRCVPDDPTSCSAEDFKREVLSKRCVVDDPTPCQDDSA
ncbi:uncharacterized protein LDX57_011483 [Aspergillus melleus]|uniref:uncharacterized protein n=1 Tax=Aspergillus melleus TaxID=138277 RepID=UPI001E8EB8D6|nr:uncharacterized protein LDX57_011483 [Aspergillus melleus]KAH8433846.1 hypothetical protein LDX57_011483 [Aspergillus melleus]